MQRPRILALVGVPTAYREQARMDGEWFGHHSSAKAGDFRTQVQGLSDAVMEYMVFVGRNHSLVSESASPEVAEQSPAWLDAWMT